MTGFRTITQRLTRLTAVLLLAVWQAVFAFSPLLQTGTAYADAPIKITAKTHQGQEAPAGTYTSGNTTTYTESDPINFRFTLSSNGATSGQLEVRFTGDDSTCLFFDGAFNLGTHDGSAPAIESVSGAVPTVTTVGTPVATDFGTSSGEWVQTLNVSFDSAGEAVINYWLVLSNEAGECNGSSQHSRLNPAGGNVEQTGQQNVPVPANQIIELPEIYVQKWVDTNADGTVDRKATAGEWSFSLDGAAPVATDANGDVTFINVTPDGDHTITETNGPAQQTFLSGSGTSCTFDGSTATATVLSGTTATDATCVFNNTIQTGSITIAKDAIPNSAQDFAFTATGSGTSDFSLDDDSDATLSNSRTFSGLVSGDYTFTESATSGWDFDSITCPGATVTKRGATVTISLSAGQNVTCTYTNRQRGHIVVHKVTDPANDPTGFQITASGSGNIAGSATQTLSTTQDVTYDVAQGTYAVSEDVPAGWRQDSNTCSNLVINGNTPLVAGVPTVTCTITNTKLARLKIVKDAVPNGPQDFTFSTTGTGLTGFSLDDDSDATLLNNRQFTDLSPGAYSVTEAALTGWDLTGVSCTGSSSNSQTDTTLNITLAAGEDATCTFTNTQRGSILGIKFNDLNGNGVYDQDEPTLSGWTIQLWSDGNMLGEQVTDANGAYSFTNIINGLYNLIEVMQTGWVQTLAPEPVTLNPGETDSGNNFGNQGRGTIIIEKQTQPDGDTTSFAFTASYDNDGFTLSDGQTNNSGSIPAGTYSVSEAAVEGWDLSSATCSDKSDPSSIEVSAGETVTCTFTNTKRGSVTIIKDAQPDSSQAFKFTGDLGDPDDEQGPNFTLVDDGLNDTTDRRTFTNLTPGTYTVTEPSVKGWSLDSINCVGGADATANERNAVIKLEPGENVTCTFVNTRDTGHIIVDKVTNPSGSTQSFDFTTTGEGYQPFSLTDEAAPNDQSVVTGTYSVSETATTGWDLTGAVCDNEQSPDSITVEKDQTVHCTFTNTQRGAVRVTKYNDLNRNQTYDVGEPTLEGWVMHLTDVDAESTQDQTTDVTGVTTFANVDSRNFYALSETQQSENGWSLSDIDCNGVEGGRDGDAFFFNLTPGQTVDCFVGNYHTIALNLAKTNNRPLPTTVGDTVTYTMVVTVPEQSGASFDSSVTDLPPAGFTYIRGSWTALVKHANGTTEDLKAANITTEPTYGSPGTWYLGTLLPGDTVILTYQTLIQDSVDGGTYPDNAFAFGCGLPSQDSCPDSEVALSNQTITPDDPFRGTEVTVLEPQVLGASITRTVLVNTGSETKLIQLFAGLLLLTALAAALKTSYDAKGGRR